MKIDNEFVEEFISILDKHEITPIQLQGVFQRAGYTPRPEPSSRHQSFVNFFQPLLGVEVGSGDFKNIINEIKDIPKNVKPGFKPITAAEIAVFLEDVRNLLIRYS